MLALVIMDFFSTVGDGLSIVCCVFFLRSFLLSVFAAMYRLLKIYYTASNRQKYSAHSNNNLAALTHATDSTDCFVLFCSAARGYGQFGDMTYDLGVGMVLCGGNGECGLTDGVRLVMQILVHHICVYTIYIGPGIVEIVYGISRFEYLI